MEVFRKLHVAKQLFRFYRRTPLFKLRHESFASFPGTRARGDSTEAAVQKLSVCTFRSGSSKSSVRKSSTLITTLQSPSHTSSRATDKCVWKHGRNKLDRRSTRTSRIFRAVYPCTSFEYIERKASDFCRLSAQTNIRIVRLCFLYHFFFFFKSLSTIFVRAITRVLNI